LYLDGVLVHSPLHTTDGQPGNGSLTIFSGDLVDEMTLYQGAWPVRYSDRTAGVLAVDTRPGTREDIRTQVSASASNASVVAEGPLSRSRRGSWVVSFRKSYLQYILNRIDFGDQAPLAFGFADVQARVDFDVAPAHTISVSVLDGSSSVDRSRFRDQLGPNTLMTSGFRSTIVNIGSRYATPRLLVSSHLAWSGDRGHVENRDAAPLTRQDFSGVTARSDATATWSPKHSLEFGGLFRSERTDQVVTQLLYAPTLVATVDHARGHGDQAGAYAQQASQFAHVRVTTGVRIDSHSLSSTMVGSPYASASITPSAKTRVQFDWGRYGQFPELSQYRSTFAHAALRPERATDYEAMVERHLDDRTRLRLELYSRQDRDLLARPAIDPRIGGDGSLVQAAPEAPLLNAQHGYSRGVQVYIQRRSANGVAGWISYAYGHAVTTDDTLHLTFPADDDQRHTFNVYATRRLRPTVNLSAHVTYGSGTPLPGFYAQRDGNYVLAQNRNQLRAPSYQRADVRLNKVYVGRRLDATLFVEVINVSNHTNRDFDTAGAYDAIGRTQPGFYSMFPVLPSAGMVMTFGRGATRKVG
jgi:outer membrane cobalamin receptor